MHIDCIGSISYWVEISKKADVVLYSNHTFQKQSSLSQFEITTSNGRLKLSVPTKKSTRKGALKDVEIDYTSNWQIEHWRSIENAYLKSPFFLYYGYKIERVFKSNPRYLLDFNISLFNEIAKCIKLSKAINEDSETSQYYKEIEVLNHKTYPQVFDTKQPFVPNLCILDLLFNLGPETLEFLLNS
ncbi:MAG: WbqC family protein [Bacteroidia bacterium]